MKKVSSVMLVLKYRFFSGRSLALLIINFTLAGSPIISYYQRRSTCTNWFPSELNRTQDSSTYPGWKKGDHTRN